MEGAISSFFGIPYPIVGFVCFIQAGIFIYVWPKAKAKAETGAKAKAEAEALVREEELRKARTAAETKARLEAEAKARETPTKPVELPQGAIDKGVRGLR